MRAVKPPRTLAPMMKMSISQRKSSTLTSNKSQLVSEQKGTNLSMNKLKSLSRLSKYLLIVANHLHMFKIPATLWLINVLQTPRIRQRTSSLAKSTSSTTLLNKVAPPKLRALKKKKRMSTCSSCLTQSRWKIKEA